MDMMIFCNPLPLYSSSPSLSPLTWTRTKLRAQAQSRSVGNHSHLLPRRSMEFPYVSATSRQLSTAEDHDDLLWRKLMEFPYVSAMRRQLMVDLMTTVEDRLQSQLLPCSLPPDVGNFKNPNGSAEASIHIRSGEKSSPINFVIGTWIHYKFPTGESLNITSISGLLNSSTDAPNFVAELIQSSPTSLVIILDLPHRKDLVLHPDYLKTYYEDTALDSHRQSLLKLPEIKPYVSPSLFVRSSFSPAASMLQIDVEEEGKLEEILRDHVIPAAKEVLGVWLDLCGCGREEEKITMGEEEKLELERRDKSFRKKNLEDDMDLKFPRMFGEEVASRVVHAIKETLGVL